jgi:crotonobetainyl-CoA:carnitine CoA-transferase CaiB-like acyl-CoA transferase
LAEGDAFSRDEFAHAAGEDNESVLGELLGMSTETIAALKEREVLR